MDLGATICVSRVPRCERCPLAAECAALAATARATLFPSGEALARLRDAAQPEADVSTVPDRRVAESPAPYATAAATPGRRKPASQPFTSTSRYFRGRVLAVLREHDAGVELMLGQIGPRIKADWTPEDLPWLAGLVAGLARDGLVRLAGAPAATRAASASDDALRVSLP
jgi:A/G-specific adenine glycosylase